MKSYLIKFLLLLVSSNLVYSRALEANAAEPRTFGNFVPKIQNIIENSPNFQPDPLITDPVAIAKQYIEKNSGDFPVAARVSSWHKSPHNGVTHVYLQQFVNGIPVSNGVANVNIDDKGKIISAGNSFYRHGDPPAIDFSSTDNLISAPDAVISFAKLLKLDIPDPSSLRIETRDGNPTVSGAPFALKPIRTEHKYVQVDGGLRLAHTWDLRVEMAKNYYHTHVDTSTGDVISLVDWVSDATYNIFPFGVNDPEDGSRARVTDPWHVIQSPLKWDTVDFNKKSPVTISNNVFAQNNPNGGDAYLNNHRPAGGPPDLQFDFPLDLSKAPSTYIDASITNLFYWNNLIHDLFSFYGFTEKAGNFQTKNFGRGGEEGDAVIAFAQDGSGTNNAYFQTLPDGEPGVMRMFSFTITNPDRDGDFDSGIIIHEYSHGLSTRLTGGGSNVDCLPDGEAGAMGEGWGDFIATILRTTKSSTRNSNYAMGTYVLGNQGGIRHFPYSTSMITNPLKYSYLQQPEFQEVHSAGEIWVEMLYEVYWNLVDAYGFTSDWFSLHSKKGGNMIALQLVIDGMKFQPCFPTFIVARDAILTADQVNYNGKYRCLIWRGFAKRGLGFSAVQNGNDSFDLPPGC